jgi:hypothetical protein
VSAVFCQVEVSATNRSLVQSSFTKCGVSECDLEASIMRRPWPTRGCWAMGVKSHLRGYKRTFLCFLQEIYLQILDRLITTKNTTSILKMRFRIARFRGTVLLLALRKITHTFSDSAFFSTFRREERETPPE